MSDTIKIVSVDPSTKYDGLLKVTLSDGKLNVTCDGISWWDPEEDLYYVFDEWKDMALLADEGYSAEACK